MASRKTSQLPNLQTPTLNSFFDFVDPNESLPIDRDKTTTFQLLAELLIEIIGDGSIEGVVFTEDFTVRLSNGKTFGKYLNGEVVPAEGLSAKAVILLAAIEYLAPDFATLTNASLIKTFEVGEPLPSGSQSIDYTISEFAQVKAQPPDVGVPSTNITGATFPTNPFELAASGAFNIIVPSAFKLSAPGNQTITLTGTNSIDGTFNITATIKWRNKVFYGPSASAPTDSATVRALPSSEFESETTLGDSADTTLILNTGTTNSIFTIALPPGKTLVSVFDLDALNAPLTTQYQDGLTTFNVNDANGDPFSYKVYTLVNGGPYLVNHRHSVIFS